MKSPKAEHFHNGDDLSERNPSMNGPNPPDARVVAQASKSCEETLRTLGLRVPMNRERLLTIVTDAFRRLLSRTASTRSTEALPAGSSAHEGILIRREFIRLVATDLRFEEAKKALSETPPPRRDALARIVNRCLIAPEAGTHSLDWLDPARWSSIGEAVAGHDPSEADLCLALTVAGMDAQERGLRRSTGRSIEELFGTLPG